ncbi:nuclear transport factor 2 family protein [Actinomadura rugatobispora]|uniref:Nuclear transport factor 2 family protein n=1 Tax=Actinomadura rugatobispora TaxID=1994 RepID=A0ABW1A3H0_9ACTN|nr:hypothetical protein GCM10010200_106750 [Actinomadura rugatobispora]
MPASPEDHAAISTLLARYCLTLDLEDVEGWVSLFTPDARYEVYGRTFDGHDGLREVFTASPRGMHLGGVPAIEMTGADRARTTRNLLFADRSDGASSNVFYVDDLVRTPEGWRIAACRSRLHTADGLADRPAS